MDKPIRSQYIGYVDTFLFRKLCGCPVRDASIDQDQSCCQDCGQTRTGSGKPRQDLKGDQSHASPHTPKHHPSLPGQFLGEKERV